MINRHLTPDEITGYIYNTLDSGCQEIVDSHMLDCKVCRANLTEEQTRHRLISNELSAVLKTASPSTHMNFAAILPRLHNQSAGLVVWPRLLDAGPAAIAFAGLLLAVLGLWQAIGLQAITTPTQQLGAFPTLAGFFLMLASVGQFDRSITIQPRSIMTWLVAVILWLGSAFIGLLNLIVIRDLAIMAVVALGGRSTDAAPIAILSVLVGALCYIAVVIGGGDYHYRHIGQPGSWKLLSITILVQLFILIIPYLVW